MQIGDERRPWGLKIRREAGSSERRRDSRAVCNEGMQRIERFFDGRLQKVERLEKASADIGDGCFPV